MYHIQGGALYIHILLNERYQDMIGDQLYYERLSSPRTSALFITLTLLFLLFFIWRFTAAGFDALAVVLLVFCLFFLFYSINYRTLVIQLVGAAIRLEFGFFHWTIPFANIASAALDDLPAFKKYGGAGIHFMTVNGRYRASFNFLEYPRLLINLKKKSGLVQEVSFSTRRPDQWLNQIRTAEYNADGKYS